MRSVACTERRSSGVCVLPLQVGKKNRSVGATLMNQDSSRSHSIFTITIETIEQTQAQVGPAGGWTNQTQAP